MGEFTRDLARLSRKQKLTNFLLKTVFFKGLHASIEKVVRKYGQDDYLADETSPFETYVTDLQKLAVSKLQGTSSSEGTATDAGATAKFAKTPRTPRSARKQAAMVAALAATAARKKTARKLKKARGKKNSPAADEATVAAVNGAQPKKRCHFCNHPGHIQKDCWHDPNCTDAKIPKGFGKATGDRLKEIRERNSKL